ncbi:MAG: hypothetical protein KGN84_14210 [Acidobacteriota bacterium]|nr:hypothetical protein [Acidobacteriota bacterium]
METKTYFASSVPAALELAGRELGGDAMLVRSRPAPPEMRGFGRLEVTFAFEPKAVRQAVAPGKQTSLLPFGALRALQASRTAPPVSEIDELRRELAELKSGLGARGGVLPVSPRELAASIPEATFAEMTPGENRALALVGPPGRGKTTTLVKIAMKFGLARRVPVRIYSAGSHGVCGEEQMARFATILGVPYQACESLEGLGPALSGEAWKGLVLIDTPGLSPADTAEISRLAGFFGRHPEIEKHLVLRADARSADMTSVVSRFSAMGVSRLLFTGLDEVGSLAALVETLVQTRIPAVFAGTGQEIPEDLELIDAACLARAVCGEDAMAAVAA